MIDLENLTIVESLTFNAILWKSRELGKAHKLDLLGDIHELSDIGFDLAVKDSKYSETLSKYSKHCNALFSNESWIFRTAHNKACKKLAWPAVKLQGYTKARALKEARNTIQFVKDRMKTI